MVISALGFVKNPQATPTLIELLDDEQVNGHVIGALRARRVVAAIPLLARFEEHPNAWIRRSARNAIAALTKRARAVTIH
jgi:HEAT repeat protein